MRLPLWPRRSPTWRWSARMRAKNAAWLVVPPRLKSSLDCMICILIVSRAVVGGGGSHLCSILGGPDLGKHASWMRGCRLSHMNRRSFPCLPSCFLSVFTVTHESSNLSFAMLRHTSIRVAGILLAAISLTDASATLARRQVPADDAPSVWQYRGCWRYVDVCFYTLQ